MIREAAEKLKDKIDKEILLDVQNYANFLEGELRDEQKPYRYNRSTGS